MAQRVVVVLNGGLVDSVFSELKEAIEVVVVDWDDLETQGYEAHEYDPAESKLVRGEDPLSLAEMPRDLDTVIAQWDRYQAQQKHRGP